MKRIGIFGASECGKTTLAIHLSRAYWQENQLATLALDPWLSEHRWGPQAWVTKDESIFWDAVWKRRGDLVIVDEGSSTIARDRDLIPLFVKIRHQKHTLLVVGHDATDLLPTMRRNLNELFLFCQPPESIKLWNQSLPGMRGLDAAAELNQFEFVHCENFSTAQRKRLKL